MDWQGSYTEDEVITVEDDEDETSQDERIIIEYNPEPEQCEEEEMQGSSLECK